jgi:hypothetical protein
MYSFASKVGFSVCRLLKQFLGSNFDDLRVEAAD